MKDFLKFTLATVTGIILSSIVLFIISMVTLFGIMSASDTETIVKKNSVMMLDLNGTLVERTQEDPLGILSQLFGDESNTYGLDDILSSIRSGKLRLWEINDEILRIKYFCKEKIERASAFTESDKSGVRFDDLNAYFVEAIKSQDKGYFEAFIRAYEPVLQSRAERFVSHYNLSADDTEDIKQIFLETLWFAFLGYDAADPIPLLQYVKKAAVMRQLDYIRTTKNACTVPTRNGYAELRKVMRIYNSAPELPADARIALAVKETGFAEKKVTELVAVGKACEYPIGIVPTEENENAADGTVGISV